MLKKMKINLTKLLEVPTRVVSDCDKSTTGWAVLTPEDNTSLDRVYSFERGEKVMDKGKLEFEVEMLERRVEELLEDLKKVRDERDELKEEIDKLEGELDEAGSIDGWQETIDELEGELVPLRKMREQVREFCADCESEKPKARYLYPPFFED